MASRFTPDIVADQHARFLRQRGGQIDETEAREQLETHTGFELSADRLRQPRIVLLATEFPYTVTATAVWLSEMGIDITLRLPGVHRRARCTRDRLAALSSA